jgi:hypothetical protein
MKRVSQSSPIVSKIFTLYGSVLDDMRMEDGSTPLGIQLLEFFDIPIFE